MVLTWPSATCNEISVADCGCFGEASAAVQGSCLGRAQTIQKSGANPGSGAVAGADYVLGVFSNTRDIAPIKASIAVSVVAQEHIKRALPPIKV